MRRKPRGLTLLETVVSLWLVFMAIVMSSAVLHRILRHSKTQEQRTRAAYLAQGKMEELMLLPAGELVSDEASFEPPFEGYRWRLEVEPVVKFRGKMVLLRLHVTTPVGEEFILRTQRRGRPERLWFCSNNNASRLSRLYQVNEDGTELTAVPTGDSHCNDHYPTFSPDGSLVAFLSDRTKKQQLYLMPSDGSAPPTAVTHHPMGVQEPQWSPDGRSIAYVAYDQGFSQIYLYDVQAEKSQVVSQKGSHEGAPAWSPKGAALAFVTTRKGGGGTQLAMMKPDGTQRRVLTHMDGWNTAPSFSPDGKTIVFMSSRDGDSELYTLTMEGGKIRRLTSSSGYDNNPRYSPDGVNVVFSSARRGPRELFLMTSEGEDQRPLIRREEGELDKDVFEKEPCWVPFVRKKTQK